MYSNVSTYDTVTFSHICLLLWSWFGKHSDSLQRDINKLSSQRTAVMFNNSIVLQPVVTSQVSPLDFWPQPHTKKPSALFQMKQLWPNYMQRKHSIWNSRVSFMLPNSGGHTHITEMHWTALKTEEKLKESPIMSSDPLLGIMSDDPGSVLAP